MRMEVNQYRKKQKLPDDVNPAEGVHDRCAKIFFCLASDCSFPAAAKPLLSPVLERFRIQVVAEVIGHQLKHRLQSRNAVRAKTSGLLRNLHQAHWQLFAYEFPSLSALSILQTATWSNLCCFNAIDRWGAHLRYPLAQVWILELAQRLLVGMSNTR